MLPKEFSKLVLWLPLFFLFIFCVDIYFTVPNADDYDFFIWVDKYGFFDFQKFMYLNQNGRFVSAFFIACYSVLFNGIHSYWIFPLFFFILYFSSIVFFIKVFFECLRINIISLTKYSYAAYVTLLFILVCKEMSSFLFWMPGIINYQLPVTFLIFGISCIIKCLFAKNKISLITGLTCIALASGCHEMIFLLITPGLLVFIILYLKNKNLRNILILIFFSILIPFLISILSPGTTNRQVELNTNDTSIINLVAGSLIRVVFLFSNLLAVPYLYIVLALVYIFFIKINNPEIKAALKNLNIKVVIIVAALQPLFIFLLTMKKFGSGLPERVDNLLLIQLTIFLLLIAIKSGVDTFSLNSIFYRSALGRIFISLLIFLCICSPNFINGIKGIFAGYYYKQISEARIKNAENKNGITSLHLTHYENELDSFYKKKYNKRMPDKLFSIANKKQIILFRDVDDLLGGQNNSFRHYHNIDTLKTPFSISYGDTLIYLSVKKHAL